MSAKSVKCSVTDCGRDGRGNAAGNVLCGMHYQRWVKFGSTDLPNRRASTNGLCLADDCDRPVRSLNASFCCVHYTRLRRSSPLGMTPVNIQCVQCDEPLPRGHTSYCSALCQNRHRRGTPHNRNCKICGKPFPTWEQTGFCSDECRTYQNRFFDHRRRAVVRGAKAEKFSSLEIFQRDGWRCQLCGQKVLRKAPARHPLSASLDHIVPIAKGGDHTRKNAQCAHLACNMRKQARIIGQMRLFG